MKKTAHYIPDYTVKGSQEAQYGKGYGIIPDLYRDGKIDGLRDHADNVRRIKQDRKTIEAFFCEKRIVAANAPDYSDYMSLQNLSAIHAKAFELKKILEHEEQLEDWVEDKISSVADDMDELHNYFLHRGKSKE